jgi:hypothetical protein
MTEPEEEPEPEPVIVSDEKTHQYYMGKMKPFFNYIDGIEAKFYYEVPDYKVRWQTLSRVMISKNAHENSIGRTQMVSWRASASKGIQNVMGKFGGDLGEVLRYFIDDGLILASHLATQDRPPDPPWNWLLDMDKKPKRWVYKDNEGGAEPIYPERERDGHWSPGPWDMNPSKEGDRKDGCSICIDSQPDGMEDWVTTICGHSFHKVCLLSALEKKPACPLCRGELGYMVDALTSDPPPAPPEVKWKIKWKLFIISLVINEYIYYASLVGDTEFIRYLTELGGGHAAAKGTDLNAVLSGTDKGEADPSSEWFNKTYFEDTEGQAVKTPLLAAISEGQVEIVKLIIDDLGVDPLKHINKGRRRSGFETALPYAITNAKMNKAEIVEFLITKMIDERKPLEMALMWSGGARRWEAPLERAFKTKDTNIITLLIEKGANFNLKFSSDKYPLDVALEENMEEIKDLLEGKKATRTLGWWEQAVGRMGRMGQCVSPEQCGPGPVLQTDETLEAEPEPEPETGRAAMKKFKKKTKKKKSKRSRKSKKTKKRKTRRRRS